jgi:hypothetical protein
METTHAIQATERNGNLHIELQGHFSAATAAILTDSIRNTYRGNGNIFIHTAGIISVSPDSRKAFAARLMQAGLPSDKLFLMGTKGLDLSPEKVRVIIVPEKKKACCGRCQNCKCGNDN